MGDHIVGEAHAATEAGHTTAWRSGLASPAVRTVAVFLPAAAGFAIAQVDKGGDARFTTSLEFLIWSGLIAVAVAAWVAMSLGLLPTVRELRGLFGVDGPAIPIPGLFGIYALYAAVLFAALTAGDRPMIPLDHFSFRIRTVFVIGLASAASTVVTLWLVAERLRRLHPLLAAGAPLPDAGERVDELRTLWRCSMRSLAAASVAVSIAVVLASAMRNALLAYDRATWEKAFPASGLLVYGALFTVAFAAVYMPTLLTWRSRARQLVDAVYPTPPDLTASRTRRGPRAAPRWSSSLASTSASWPSFRACSPSSAHLRRASSPPSSPSSRMGSRPRRWRIAVHPIPAAPTEPPGLGECWIARRLAVDL